jgi:hypothetical protein
MGPLLFETMKPGSRHDRAAIDSLSIMFRLSCERLKPHVLRAFEVRVRSPSVAEPRRSPVLIPISCRALRLRTRRT